MDIASAKKIAAKFISYKMYSCGEICRKLMLKGCDKETAETVVAEFVNAGILNDMEYAKAYIHDAMLIGLKGMFRIRQELLAKGVAKSIIDKAEEDCGIDADAQLKSYVELRFSDRMFEDYKDIEKAKMHLVRRGYSISDINRCFKELGIRVEQRGDMD